MLIGTIEPCQTQHVDFQVSIEPVIDEILENTFHIGFRRSPDAPNVHALICKGNPQQKHQCLAPPVPCGPKVLVGLDLVHLI